MATTKRIEKNLERIRENIADACKRAERNAADVSLVAVTKAVDLATIKNCLDVGLTDLGESRAQQLAQRAADLTDLLQRARKEYSPVRWHMIGHLQRNKVKSVLGATNWVHSVDSLRLAEEISQRAEKINITANVFLEVNTAEESRKEGCAVGAAVHLGEMIASLKNVRLAGLMAMAPLSDDTVRVRHAFTRLRELFEEMRYEKIGGDGFKHLSMGMSHDYELAVEEGATILRIGSALFE
jgi:pyridoxal phosphate enzyme (YggS family)